MLRTFSLPESVSSSAEDMSVATSPGATALDVMPYLLYIRANDMVRLISPAFAAA